MTVTSSNDIPMPELALESGYFKTSGSVKPRSLIPRNSKGLWKVFGNRVMCIIIIGKTSSKKRRASVAQQRKDVNQLQREVTIKRLPVSVAVSDLVTFVSKQSSQDFLVSGNEVKKTNPFREKPLPTVLCLPLTFSRNRRRSCTMWYIVIIGFLISFWTL